MSQKLYKQNISTRVTGRLCFSPNFAAVVFVQASQSDAVSLNWDIIADATVFFEFARAFEVRPTHVENSFYLDADYDMVRVWLEKRAGDDYSGLNTRHIEQAQELNEVVDLRPTPSDGLLAISHASELPESWKHSPIETFILAVNFDKPPVQLHRQKLGLISCDTHLNGLFKALHNLDIYEIPKTSVRDAAKRSMLSRLNSRGVSHAVLIAHANCAVPQRSQEAEEIFNALVNEGWSASAAREYLSPRFPVFDEVKTLRSDYNLLRRVCKSVEFAPLFVCHFTQTLKLPAWYSADSVDSVDSVDLANSADSAD